MRFRVRFNLGAGANHMKWKVQDKVTGKVEYYDPDEIQLLLKDCKLINQKSMANKIFCGSHKQVCAWIEASSYHLCNIVPQNRPVKYNPRVAPNWRDAQGENIDGQIFKQLVTLGNQVFIGA